MSADATGWVWKHSPFDGSRLLVHLAIADVVNDAHENEFWMSAGALAKKARVSRSTAMAALSDLCDGGFLEVIESGQLSGKPTTYRFNLSRPRTGVSNLRAKGVQSSDTELKELNSTTQEGCPDFGHLANPDCFQCHGEGVSWHPGAGRDARCACTFENSEESA